MDYGCEDVVENQSLLDYYNELCGLIFKGINNLEPHYKTDDCINKNFHEIIELLASSIDLYLSFSVTTAQLSGINKPLKENLSQKLIHVLKDELLDSGTTDKPDILDTFVVDIILNLFNFFCMYKSISNCRISNDFLRNNKFLSWAANYS